jgi:hypothetical protein
VTQSRAGFVTSQVSETSGFLAAGGLR